MSQAAECVNVSSAFRLTGIPCIGAYMVGVPDSIDPQPHNSTFWKALPGGKGLFWPMFVVATLAAIVASQALISAVRACT